MQHSKIATYIQEIIEACKDDSIKREVAIANFTSLLNAMKGYERAPRYYNAIFDENDAQPNQMNMRINDKHNDADVYKYPVVGELEKIYGRKLKQCELQKLANALSSSVNIHLTRDTKRSKSLLLNWFSNNWTVIHSKIYELKLNQMKFDDPPKKT